MPIHPGLADIGDHFIQHAAMGLVSGTNPFGVTLQNACDAGNTTTTPIINDASHFANGIAGFQSSLTTQGIWFDSAKVAGGPGYIWNTTSNTADVPLIHTRWEKFRVPIAQMMVDGNIRYGTDEDDLFIHEKATVDTTGDWNVTGTWRFASTGANGLQDAILDAGRSLELVNGTSATQVGAATSGHIRLFHDATDLTLHYTDAAGADVPVSRIHWGATAPAPDNTKGLWIDTSSGDGLWDLRWWRSDLSEWRSTGIVQDGGP
jgi:hypothetical protein